MPPKSNSRSDSKGRRGKPSTGRDQPPKEFTEPNVDWDNMFGLLDPPFIHNWEEYPSYIGELIYGARVPPPPTAEAGPSSQSTSTVLPRLHIPIEQVVAALAAAFHAGQKSNEWKFREIDDKFEEIFGRFRSAKNTHEELQALKKDCEEGDQCHENLANGVVALSERVTTFESEAATAKAERDEAQKDRVAISAQLELAIQGIEALNVAMVQTQQHIEEMAEEIEALGGGQQEAEEDGIGLADLAEEPEEMEVVEQEEIIDP